MARTMIATISRSAAQMAGLVIGGRNSFRIFLTIALLLTFQNWFVYDKLMTLDSTIEMPKLLMIEPEKVQKMQIRMLTKTFCDIVTDYRNVHTMSWTFQANLEIDSRNKKEKRRPVGVQSKTSNNIDNTHNESFIWDEEEDINTYFKSLTDSCAQPVNTHNFTKFKTECLDFFICLINEPRCTNSFDSRVECQGDRTKLATSDESNYEAGKSIISHQFQDNTINVLILGAGPVGLMLANALVKNDAPLGLNGRNIRIVMFENRLHSLGRKKAVFAQLVDRSLLQTYTQNNRLSNICVDGFDSNI